MEQKYLKNISRLLLVVVSVSLLFPLTTVNANDGHSPGPVAPPVNYTPKWETINTTKFTPEETKELAQQLKDVRAKVKAAAVLSAWLYKFPGIGATVGTIAYLLEGHHESIIAAADQGKGVTFIQQKNVNVPTSYNNQVRLLIQIN